MTMHTYIHTYTYTLILLIISRTLTVKVFLFYCFIPQCKLEQGSANENNSYCSFIFIIHMHYPHTLYPYKHALPIQYNNQK